ncbi:hypothetical protein [Motilimonas eburnea]|uniref:hypothetical protein n=1 Tax=Motilimonas eburnea TaxID=1737488 RepID=UPI001E44EA73|nr:hypothetical protein [Motilimonas eburnea]MCE2572015.1 hypothetical protein [Motilimonas eburnea]
MDVEEKVLKPNNATLGITLVAISVIIGFVWSLLFKANIEMMLINGKLMFSFIVFEAIYVGVFLAIYFGENWARILFIVLQLSVLDSYYKRIFLEPELYPALLSAMQFLLFFIGIIYLLTPTANAWFKENSKRRAPPKKKP